MIQGVINAKMIALFNNKQALEAYAKTLTEEQRELARSHLKTYIKIRKIGHENKTMPR